MNNMLPSKKIPKIGCLGLGWIGKNRLEAILKNQLPPAISLYELNHEVALKLQKEFNQAGFQQIKLAHSFQDLLNEELDGIMISTPSALHAEQTLMALQSGKSVFCQKPLGRNTAETRVVVQTAKNFNKLLSVDFSYRQTAAIQAIKRVIDSGELGQIYAVEGTFHNAYGPDKPWYYDAHLSGGGCLVDLGIHLVDLFLWLLKSPSLTAAKSSLYSQGKILENLSSSSPEVEDFVSAQLLFDQKISFQLSCSWNLPAGCDAIIKMNFYGTKGGVCFRNVQGSFYDFIAERFYKTTSETLIHPPDNWGGRAAINWIKKLAVSNQFDQEAEEYIKVSQILDAIYKRS